MQRFATCCLYATCILLGVLTGRGADGTDQAEMVNMDRPVVASGTDAKYTGRSGTVVDRRVVRSVDAAESLNAAQRRVKGSGLELNDDDHFAWALYGGLVVLATIFFLSVVCWCANWSAWIRSADGLTLFRDNSSPMHLAYPTYDNLAFTSYMEKDLALGDGVVINGAYYEKSPNVHTYAGPRVGRCSESIV